MLFDQQKAEMPVLCPGCGWEGRLDQTEDVDVLGPEFEKLRVTCICPVCGSEVVPNE